ncbi:hypothetical protein [Streptomyces sp. NPDC048825]|uniref:hypothetical protein n=1 Tax=Streptomyces sp. NPDC048825 TaxID=3365592 RepID=UPI0037210E09
MTPAEEAAADLAATGASASMHPVHQARVYLERGGALTAAVVRGTAHQPRVRLGELAKYLQRPPMRRGWPSARWSTRPAWFFVRGRL